MSFANVVLWWTALLLPKLIAAIPPDFLVQDHYTASSNDRNAPTARTLNGTYVGNYLQDFNQDAFLGIPYAQPPVADLRFRRPVSLNESWGGAREARAYGKTCYQISNRTDMSEDCLSVNVVRPSGIDVAKTQLPVFVCIYGGGFSYGSSADQGYNLSHLVAASQKQAQPIVAVSMNYRVDMWGFLSSPEIFAEKNANAGLMDQRMALAWIQDNIAAFGGDPKRVTIWGVSAGAQSIGLHLHSFGGRDDGLYQAAIMESGGPVGTALQELPFYADAFHNLTGTFGCDKAEDKLACLRRVPSKDLYTRRKKKLWNPIVDGDYLTDWPSTLTAKKQFVKVPLITGANSDEGCSFSARNVDTDEDISRWLATWRSYELSPSSINRLITLYENYDYPPFHADRSQWFPGTGRKWRKSGAIGGDMVMQSQRRKVAQAYSAAGVKVWSFRFDTPSWDAKPSDGSRHGVEVVFTLQNNTGTLGPLPQYQRYKDLSEAIGKAYVNFVNRWDPNPPSGREGVGPSLPHWPSYTEMAGNMVLNANKTFTEQDDWRKEGIDFLNGISRELLS